jgi:hypothetical protein
MDEAWLPIEEFLALHNGRFSRWTLNEWARQGKFGVDCAKEGRTRWFRAGALERMLARDAEAQAKEA